MIETRVDPARFRHFVIHLKSAQDKLMESKEAKLRLRDQISKVKRYSSSKRIKNATLDKEVQILEQHIREVINKEKRLLHGQDAMKVELNEKISHLENYIAKMEQELSKMEIELAQTKVSSSRSEQLKDMINSLRDKIDNAETKREDRERKIEEFEEKIKESVNKNLQEILKVESQIKYLEERYSEAKKQKDAHPGILMRIENKISQLKNRTTHLRRREIAKSQVSDNARHSLNFDESKNKEIKMPLPPFPKGELEMPLPPPKAKVYAPKKELLLLPSPKIHDDECLFNEQKIERDAYNEIPSLEDFRRIEDELQPPYPAPRHEIKFEFNKDKSLEFMPEELPADSPAKNEFLESPPMPMKKKSFLNKLFAK